MPSHSFASLFTSAIDRPVALRMRPDLSAHPLRLGGRNLWAVKDPVSLRYYQLHEEEYHLLCMLDGQTSLNEIKQRFEARFAPRKLDIRQLQAFFSSLHREGLILADAAGQGDELLARQREAKRRRWWATFANPLAIRFRGIDPESILNSLYPLVRWAFSWWFVGLCGLLATAALTLVAVQFETLQARLPEFHAFFGPRNLLWLGAAVALAKVLHEFGHGLTCKHFGGECHEIGLMILIFSPCLYCNVSDSWILPNRWHRAAIGAAGMWVEVVLASVCTFLWWFSEPGLLHHLCLNLMFVCSVSTLVFNGNPLLRYDGYFILGDLLEMPNLRQQATAVVLRWLARGIGVDYGSLRLLPERRHGWLAAFAVASTVYRWVVLGLILWFLHTLARRYELELLVEGLAVAIVAITIVRPAWRMANWLLAKERRRQVKFGRLLMAGTAVAALVVAAFKWPLPYRVSAPVVLEPRDAHRIYVAEPGTLRSVVAVGSRVESGAEIARLENLDVEREIVVLRAQQAVQQKRVEHLRLQRVKDKEVEVQIPVAEETLRDIAQRLSQRETDSRRLTLTAPVTGTVLPPPSRRQSPPEGELARWSGTPLEARNAGSYLETGTIVCLIGDPENLEAFAVIDQSDIEFVRPGQTVRMHFELLPGNFLTGTIEEISELDIDIAPPELIALGQLPSLADASGTPRLLTTSYQARVKLDPVPHRLRLRATGQAKIDVASLSLADRLRRYLSRTFRFTEDR